MVNAIKVLTILATVLILSYPFITVKNKKLRKLFVASGLRYYSPHNRKNIFFLLLSLVEYIVLVILFKLFDKLAQFIVNIPFLGSLVSNAINSLNSQIDYIFFAVKMVLVNLIVVYAFIILKGLLKKAVIDPFIRLEQKKKKKAEAENAENDEQQNKPDDTSVKKDTDKKKRKKFSLFKRKKKDQVEDDNNESTSQIESLDETNEKIRKRRRIPDFVHNLIEDDGLYDEDITEQSKGKQARRKEERIRTGQQVCAFALL